MPFYIFLGLLLLCSIFSGWASYKVHSSYAKFDRVASSSHMTGYDTAIRLLKANNIFNVTVERTRGKLTDHFDPRRRRVNLSEATYGSDSVAAIAVAAHEIGHVVQEAEGYLPYRIRSAIVPAVNFGSRMAVPVVLVGLLLYLLLDSPIGMIAAYIGICLYGLATVFQLVTLPVELNASRRAKKMLLAEGIITEEEKGGASSVLTSAALTYVAALLTSILYFLRFALYIVAIFRRNDD